MAIEESIVAEYRAKYPGCLILSAAGVDVIARTPGRADYRRFRAESSDEKTRADAPESLTRSCVVYPDAPDFDKVLERKPALGDVFAMKLLEAAGTDEKATAKNA